MTATVVVALALGALITGPLAAPRTALGARRACVRLATSELSVPISRGPTGLGLEVSNENLVLSAPGQPGLRVGDLIVGVNGQALGGKYVGTALDPAATSLDFAVSRESPASAPLLESAVYTMAAELYSPNLLADGVSEASRARLLGLMGALEALGASMSPRSASPLGFWKMVAGVGNAASGGMSGMAAGDGCRLVAHWQMLGDKEPSAQVVEVVADPLLRRHAVAALKGALVDGAERYGRLEVGGALASSTVVTFARATVYLSDAMRLVRVGTAGEAVAGATTAGAAPPAELYAYWRTSADVAQAEIARLAEAPIDSTDPADPFARSGGAGAEDDESNLPRWARVSRDDGYDEVESGIP
jgi:hypothetical protein